MMEDGTRGLGRAGLLVSLLVWSASVPALALAMQANETAFVLLHQHNVSLEQDGSVRGFHTHAVLWVLVFIALQLSAPLLLALTLRASYRLRTAVCFALSAGVAMMLDGLGLFGLLVWLWWTLGSG